MKLIYLLNILYYNYTLSTHNNEFKTHRSASHEPSYRIKTQFQRSTSSDSLPRIESGKILSRTSDPSPKAQAHSHSSGQPFTNDGQSDSVCSSGQDLLRQVTQEVEVDESDGEVSVGAFERMKPIAVEVGVNTDPVVELPPSRRGIWFRCFAPS